MNWNKEFEEYKKRGGTLDEDMYIYYANAMIVLYPPTDCSIDRKEAWKKFKGVAGEDADRIFKSVDVIHPYS